MKTNKIVLGLSLQGFATQNLTMTYNQSQVSDNYYVPPGEVYVSPNGIFILLDGDLVQINMLCTDERGVFVPSSEMSRQLVQCPHYRRWYDPTKPHPCKGP